VAGEGYVEGFYDLGFCDDGHIPIVVRGVNIWDAGEGVGWSHFRARSYLPYEVKILEE
jgi:hypothetical protein